MTADPGRVLGVDLGTVRVGLAVSDPTGFLASPLATLDVPADRGEVAPAPPQAGGGAPSQAGGAAPSQDWVDTVAVRLATVAREQSCDAVVIGLPRALSGRDTATTAMARRVAEALERQGVRVELWDERLSSAEAERVLIGAGRRRSRRRVERDRVAAVIILQGWLDARKRR